ncbi:MAG: hypothetical protein LAO56_18915 [Acidobacteriia bacterium]|nr:hypothetical protein [Terriglobia bacterium]
MLPTFQLPCFVLLAGLAFSQPPDPPVITFTLDFPGSQPEHYSLRVQSDGAAHYESSGKISSDSDETDSFDLDFTASPAIRQKIFELAAKADYFQKDLDSHHKNIAFTGKKTLCYKDGKRSGESTYNYSSQPAAQELTSLFQNLSVTLEFGHRLHYDHRYQKLALDDELKHMEEMARSSPMIELTAIAPILQHIIGDATVINVSRARAQRLLERAGIH